MKSGNLDRRIHIVRTVQTGTTPLNEPIFEDVEIAALWAHRQDVSDSERYTADIVLSTLLTRFTIRSTETTRGILLTDTIVHTGWAWNIDGIKETGRRDYLEITARTSREPYEGEAVLSGQNRVIPVVGAG